MPHRMIAKIFSTAHVYKRENEILREMLRGQGLSDATIQRTLKSRLKRRKMAEDALLLMTRACEELLKRFPDIDLESELAKADLKGPVQ